MIANYHTHTVRCQHASDPEEAYIRRALEGGMQILGFADHAPNPFKPEVRMRQDQFQDYVDTLQNLARSYADRIQILIGLEAEYYPAHFPEFLQRIQDTPVQYLILGQHWLGPDITPYSGRETMFEDTLQQYCDQVIEAIYTGVFTYVAHPDFINYKGAEAIYRKHVRRVCQAARACAMPLEINLLGLRQERHYPNRVFWEVAAEEGCQAILGCDAHSAADVWDPQLEQKARLLAKTCGISLLDTVQLTMPTMR